VRVNGSLHITGCCLTIEEVAAYFNIVGNKNLNL
jgi:hypothetical protein